jgi:glycosyltransferase involved in cell wall biosynthesis
MSSTRILALLPFLVKGALSIEILRALREKGVEIDVAFCEVVSDKYPPDALDDFRATGDLIDLAGLSGPRRLQLIDDLLARDQINLIVQIGATDLYHHLPYWKERRPALRIIDILYNEFGHTLNHFLYEPCIDAVIVESRFMQEFVKRSSRKAEPGVEILHSGVDLQDFVPHASPMAPSPLKVGYVGRMAPEKNPMGFVELAKKLAAMDSNLQFEMFGSGGDAAAVQQAIAASGMGPALQWHGFVEHPRDALGQLDVLIVPSKFDGRPVTIMEANACGIPVIAAPVGGIPELVCEGKNGFLLQPSEVDRIHALLASWQRDAEALEAQKRAAREYALRHFDRAKMFEAYAAFFDKVASS